MHTFPATPISLIFSVMLAAISMLPDQEQSSTATQDKSVDALIKEVKAGDVKSQLAALKALEQLGPKAAPAISALIVAFTSEDANVRRQISVTLREIKEGVVPALIKALKDEKRNVRRGAAETMWMMERRAEEAVPALIEALEDEDVNVRQAACASIAMLGPRAKAAVPVLCEKLKKGDAGLSVYAIGAFQQMGPQAKDAVPALCAALKNRTGSAMDAALALGEIGPEAKEAVPALADLLHNGTRLHRLVAARSLWRITQSKEAMAFLIQEVQDNTNPYRGHAANFLGKFGPAARDAVPALVKALAEDKSDDLFKILDALQEIGSDDKVVVPSVVMILKHQDSSLRAHAAHKLATIGPSAEALPALLESLADSDHLVRFWTVRALGKLGPAAKSAVPVLIETLNREREDGSMVGCIAVTLGQIGPDARAAVPSLKEMLVRRDASISTSAALALWRIEKQKNEVLSVLTKKLEGKEEGDRWFAVEALGEMGAAAMSAVPAIEAIVKGPDRRLRFRAVLALWRIDPATEPRWEVFADILHNKDKNDDTADQHAWEAVSLLKEFGHRAKTLVPILIRKWNEGGQSMRRQIVLALRQIDPEGAAEAGIH
jgi:HEAT repeat protein